MADIRVDSTGGVIISLSKEEKEWAIALGETGEFDFPRPVANLRDLEFQSIMEFALAKKEALS